MRNACKILVEKPEGRELETHKRRREDMDLREIGWRDVDCIVQAQVREQQRTVAETAMNFRVP
jgi:hypothetical protein